MLYYYSPNLKFTVMKPICVSGALSPVAICIFLAVAKVQLNKD
jgi:hypothetical protein